MADPEFDPDTVRPGDWNPEIIPEVDPDTGMSLGAAAAESTVLGISLSWISGILAGAFILVVVGLSLRPLFIQTSPEQSPAPGGEIVHDPQSVVAQQAVDMIQDPVSEDTLRSLRETLPAASSPNVPTSDHDPRYPTIAGGDVISVDDPRWELTLQTQRLAADPKDWPALVEKHKEIYRTLGVDPCTSHFFPQGCSQ